MCNPSGPNLTDSPHIVRDGFWAPQCEKIGRACEPEVRHPQATAVSQRYYWVQTDFRDSPNTTTTVLFQKALRLTMGPKMITHTFFLFGNQFLNYTGHLLHRAFWHEFFCVIGRLHKVLSVNAPITHINCLGINFPITHTSVTQKNCSEIVCVIISGLIVVTHSTAICDSIAAIPPIVLYSGERQH